MNMETIEHLKRHLDLIRTKRQSIRDQIDELYCELNNASPERREMIGNRINDLINLDIQLAAKEDEIRSKLEEMGEEY